MFDLSGNFSITEVRTPVAVNFGRQRYVESFGRRLTAGEPNDIGLRAKYNAVGPIETYMTRKATDIHK